MKNLIEIFDTLEDPRDNRGKKHRLTDVIVMNINGIPSADTFLRIFLSIELQKFMVVFSDWIKGIVSSSGKVIAIDGKAIKSSEVKEYFDFALNDKDETLKMLKLFNVITKAF